ncbi:MAG: hypothetical protein H8K05_11025 [Nitrospira sp.]|nr:hypothetical protein [Nitrospira sp.]
MKGHRESQSSLVVTCAAKVYGFFSGGGSPAAGEQFTPAKGFSGLSRGEQRCASGAAFSEASFAAGGDNAGSPGPGWGGTIGAAERDGGIEFAGSSVCAGAAGSTGGVNPPGSEGVAVSIATQPGLPFGWSVRMVRPLAPWQR